MTLDAAQALCLMGRPESWGNRGGKPLGTVPEGTLKQARSFFLRCLQEGKSPRMEQQVDAINLILADIEAHHPQARLAL